MAITNYTELRTAVENWIDRTDLTDRVPEFIALAEAKFNRIIRIRQNETTTTGTLTGATDTISFPADCAAISKVQLNTTTEFILEQTSRESLIRKGESYASGLPRYFAVNGNQIQVKPTADTDYTYELSYYQNIPSIETNTTNWLLTLYPDVYLYGALAEAAPYMKDNEETVVWKAQAASVLVEIMRADKRDRYSGGTLRARTV